VVGALDVQSTVPQAFSPDDVAILVTIADQLAVALQNARLFDQTARQARRESQVVEITGKIRAAGDMDAMLRTAVTELRQALGARQAAVALHTPATEPVPAPAAESSAPTSEAARSAGSARTAGNGNGAAHNGHGAHGANGSGPDSDGPSDPGK